MRNLLTLAALAMLASCGSENDDRDDLARETVEPQGTDGQATSVMLPEPLTLYPGAKIEDQLDFSMTGAGRVVTQRTGESVEEVLSFYEKQLADAGVEARVTRISPEMGSITAGKDHNRGFALAINREGNETEIIVTDLGE
ncbi:hypothetical protein [Sphingomicrobium nitratireducens]|uniref:hypothetical protein n=1 Tax=Sphingomicrobium nitratireducens TaxID=2964666 RepID=UPI00223EC2DE|nr:hypothetical protein [Sphingomicrobium nitratireducens]